MPHGRGGWPGKTEVRLGSYGTEDGPGRFHARHGVWCE